MNYIINVKAATIHLGEIEKLESMDLFLKASVYTNYFTPKISSLSIPNISEDFVCSC
jgi:hypothetical protein